MTERIAHLRECGHCKGTGALPAVISLDGGFTPGIVCPRCEGKGSFVVGGCMCDEEHDDEEDAT
jgi:DnaJ-class molecular chaperone